MKTISQGLLAISSAASSARILRFDRASSRSAFSSSETSLAISAQARASSVSPAGATLVDMSFVSLDSCEGLPAVNRHRQPSSGRGEDGNANLAEKGEFARQDLPPLDLAAMVRVSEACKRAEKMRTLAALRIANARIRQANLQRHLPT